MNTGIILSLVLGGLLAVIPAGILWLLDRSRLMTFGIAIVQMGVQLLLLCGVVWALIKVDKLWLSLLWLLLATGWLTWLVVKRCKLELGRYALPIGVGLLVSTLLVGLWLLLAVSPAHSLAAQWFVPVTALLSGHSAIRLIQGFSTYIEALKTDEQQYEFLRGKMEDTIDVYKELQRTANAFEFGVNLCSPGLCVFVLLNNENAGTLTQNKTVAVFVKRTGSRLGIIIPCGKGLCRIESAYSGD